MDQHKVSSTRIQQNQGITWIDIQNPSRDELKKLTADYPFHPLHLEDSLLKGQFPQVEREADYVFLLLYVPSYNEQEDKIAASQVGVFLGKDYLITVHEESASEIRDLFNSCTEDSKLCQTYLRNSAGFLLYNIISKILQDLTRLMQRILQELDDIEDKVFDNNASDVYSVGQLRKKITRLRRLISSLQKVLADLVPIIDDFTGQDLARYYALNTRTATKLRETVEEAWETIEIYKDADFTANTEKTNDILAVLTLLFTLTIPATVIGTFYGMNILLPGGIETGAWRFWGEYTTLIVMLITSALLGAFMFIYFKRKDWF